MFMRRKTLAKTNSSSSISVYLSKLTTLNFWQVISIFFLLASSSWTCWLIMFLFSTIVACDFENISQKFMCLNLLDRFSIWIRNYNNDFISRRRCSMTLSHCLIELSTRHETFFFLKMHDFIDLAISQRNSTNFLHVRKNFATISKWSWCLFHCHFDSKKFWFIHFCANSILFTMWSKIIKRALNENWQNWKKNFNFETNSIIYFLIFDNARVRFVWISTLMIFSNSFDFRIDLFTYLSTFNNFWKFSVEIFTSRILSMFVMNWFALIFISIWIDIVNWKNFFEIRWKHEQCDSICFSTTILFVWSRSFFFSRSW